LHDVLLHLKREIKEVEWRPKNKVKNKKKQENRLYNFEKEKAKNRNM
jgi:hypothetical protein